MQTKGSQWEQREKRCITSQGYKEKSEIIKDVFELYTYIYTRTERHTHTHIVAGKSILDRRKQLEQRHGVVLRPTVPWQWSVKTRMFMMQGKEVLNERNS